MYKVGDKVWKELTVDFIDPYFPMVLYCTDGEDYNENWVIPSPVEKIQELLKEAQTPLTGIKKRVCNGGCYESGLEDAYKKVLELLEGK